MPGKGGTQCEVVTTPQLCVIVPSPFTSLTSPGHHYVSECKVPGSL